VARPNLSGADYRAYLDALSDPHSIRIDVAVLTLDGDELSRISPDILDGQVDVDADADVSRTLTITMSDPHHALHLDSDSPDDGALYADRMLQVIYSVLVPALNDRVDVEVFTGPIVAFDRTGAQVELTAHGKEELALSTNWRPLTLKKGGKKVDAIRTIMSARAGETRFDLPALAVRHPKVISLGRSAQAWPHAKSIARSMNRHLYYDGAGICRLRIRPRRPTATFRSGDPRRANITGPVTISHDFTEIKNAVWFKGGKPKGQKKAVSFFAVAPKGHPLSPIRLGRTNADGDNVPRYLVHEVSNDHVRSKAEAKKRANALLDDKLVEVLGVGFTAVPFPHLDPLDVVRVETDDFSANVRIRQFSLPLAGGDMTIGYIDRVSRPAKRRIRHSRRRNAA
jgi:hypothetical protein